jgi:hypothetical protein
MGTASSVQPDWYVNLREQFKAELERGAAIALPAQFGSGWDGEHTVRLLIKNMIDGLQSFLATPASDAEAVLTERLQAAYAQLNAGITAMKQQGQVCIPPLALAEAPLLSDLRRWLLTQHLPIGSPAGEPTQAIVLATDADHFSLTAAPAVYLAGGLGRAQIQFEETLPEWDAERKVLYIDHPELLQISGPLDPPALHELRSLLTNWNGAPEAPLIVLADALDAEVRMLLKLRPYVVLPLSPANVLAGLPTLVGGTHWSLSRYRAARINAQSALLVLPEWLTPAESPPADRGAWSIHRVCVLEAPMANHAERFKAEQALTWRIDAEAGLVAGGGATLAWLANRLDLGAEQPLWQAALYAPMRQIMVNLLGNERAEPAFAQALEWVTMGAAPTNAYLIPPDQAGQQSLMVFGDCLQIGSLTPIRQIEQLLHDTLDLVMQQLALNALAATETGHQLERLYAQTAPAIQAGVHTLEAAARSSYAWIEQLWNRQPRLYMTWPAVGRPVPAAGLYYYVERDGLLFEHTIGFDGVPRLHKPAEPLPATKIAELTAGAGSTGVHRLFRVPAAQPDDPEAYIATCTLHTARPGALQLVANGFAPPTDARHLVLKPELLIELIVALRARREQGYLEVPRQILALATDATRLIARARPFWDTLAIVSDKLISAIERELAQTEPHSSRSFTNPCLVFHLNRVLSEGFIEGHAAAGLLPTGGYAQSKAAAAAWRSALDYARSAETISYLHLRRPERMMFGLIWRSIAHTEPPHDPAGFRPLRHLFNIATPGAGDEQNIVFWSMHYPHWNYDLIAGLRELAGQGLYLTDQDITGIAEVIVASLAANRTDHLAALTGIVAQELNMPMVKAIISHYARLAGAYEGAPNAAGSLWQQLVSAAAALFFHAWGFVAKIRLRLSPVAREEGRGDEVTG